MTACVPRNTSPVLVAELPSDLECAIGPAKAKNSNREATENFMTSFRPYCDENSGERFAAIVPVSNWRYPVGVSVAGVETVGRPGLAIGPGSAVCAATEP